ncbi:kinase [Thraustotheca clavata]|uniref:Kinase n=1 Tax=Thraustotheca clavata TaxID=74557 RepID=A0A1V9ZVP5_9STRA|nr:kinase [Thraustotheca clavata]
MQLSILAVVKGLSYLHNCATPIIHRGAKLTDFGESPEMIDSTMTNDVGTFAWIALEVILGRKYDSAADIYFFGTNHICILGSPLTTGALLSEYATHQIPYLSMTDPTSKQYCNQFKLISQIATGKPKPTIDAQDTPTWLVEMANQCLMFDASKRPNILGIESIIAKLLGMEE